jgi:hypothetical protein
LVAVNVNVFGGVIFGNVRACATEAVAFYRTIGKARSSIRIEFFGPIGATTYQASSDNKR